MSLSKIDNLVDRLAGERVSEYCENPYYTEFKKSNLKKYLNKVYHTQPDTILIGEALGYKGCGKTGIPFTSECILNSEWEGFEVEGVGNALTCTIVWEILKVYAFTPLVWNIYPFRPFRKGEFVTNRPPNFKEVQVGLEYLDELLDIFHVSNILAVGKVSYAALSKVYRDVTYIRHPANGGKLDFVKGISEWTEYQNTLTNAITTL